MESRAEVTEKITTYETNHVDIAGPRRHFQIKLRLILIILQIDQTFNV